MKIYSLLVVKDEADIVGLSVTDACRWSDKVIVIDNGSTDGTWELLQRLAAEEPKIVIYGRRDGPFHIGLRAEAFRAFLAWSKSIPCWIRLTRRMTWACATGLCLSWFTLAALESARRARSKSETFT